MADKIREIAEKHAEQAPAEGWLADPIEAALRELREAIAEAVENHTDAIGSRAEASAFIRAFGEE